MATLSTEDPVAVAVVDAVHSGDVPTLRRLLGDHQELASTSLGDDETGGMSRTLLHMATDWPGHFPNGAATVVALVEAGAGVTPASVARTEKPRSTGRQVATMWTSSMLCWTRAATSKRRAR